MAKILVVDDDPKICGAVRLALEANGHEVATASSKEEAEAVVVEYKPDLMLVDVMMPEGTEGFHLVWKIRQIEDEAVKGVPIVMVTGIHQTRATAPTSPASTCRSKPGSTSQSRLTTCSTPSTESSSSGDRARRAGTAAGSTPGSTQQPRRARRLRTRPAPIAAISIAAFARLFEAKRPALALVDELHSPRKDLPARASNRRRTWRKAGGAARRGGRPAVCFVCPGGW
jgi:CheY-like chemotaxis protein